MYKKAMGLLFLVNLILVAGFFCAQQSEAAKLAAWPVREIRLELEEVEQKGRERERTWQTGEGGAEKGAGVREYRGVGIADVAISGQRIVECFQMESEYVVELSEEDLEVLLRIVEAEAGNEDEEGKLLVANVVLNRVNSDLFPSTVKDVVFQREKGVTQFSPVSNGSYYRVKVSEETKTAVERALKGEDISEGALYFAARKYAGNRMRWFDEKLTFLFKHGGHEFFK